MVCSDLAHCDHTTKSILLTVYKQIVFIKHTHVLSFIINCYLFSYIEQKVILELCYVLSAIFLQWHAIGGKGHSSELSVLLLPGWDCLNHVLVI